jgi:hypothetical protein
MVVAAADAAPNFKTLAHDALLRAPVHSNPYVYFVADGALTEECGAAIREDFPPVKGSGFYDASALPSKGEYASLLGDLESRPMARLLGAKLGIDLEGRPRLVTVRRWSRRGDGRIHTDSLNKIATMLVYLNQTWECGRGGAIRVLRGPSDFDDCACEVAPIVGAVFAFKRSDASWHGHLPYAGERFVVQLTYLESEAAAEKKRRLGAMQTALKRIFDNAA